MLLQLFWVYQVANYQQTHLCLYQLSIFAMGTSCSLNKVVDGRKRVAGSSLENQRADIVGATPSAILL